MNGCLAKILAAVLLAGLCLLAGVQAMSDSDALDGEQGGYVPCDEAAADLPATDDDAAAVAGHEVGYVPIDEAAAGLPADTDDSDALSGHVVGFVAKPCDCGVFDALDRADQSGWGPASIGRSWSTGQSSSGGVTPSIVSSEGVLHANTSKYAYVNLRMDSAGHSIKNPLDVYVTFRVTTMGGSGAFLNIDPQRNSVFVKPAANSITNDHGDTSTIPRVIDWSAPVTVHTRMSYDAGPGEMTRQIRVWQTADTEPVSWDDTYVNGDSERHASELYLELDADGSGPFEVRVQKARVVVNNVELNCCVTFRDTVEEVTSVYPLTGGSAAASYILGWTWLYDHPPVGPPWTFTSGSHLGGIAQDWRSGPANPDPPPVDDIDQRSWVTFAKPTDPNLVAILSADLVAGVHTDADPLALPGSGVIDTEQPWRILRGNWGASQPTLSEPGGVIASGSTLFTIGPGGGATHDPEIISISLVPPASGEYIQVWIEADTGVSFPDYDGVNPIYTAQVGFGVMWDESSVFTEATLTYVWTKNTGVFEAVAASKACDE